MPAQVEIRQAQINTLNAPCNKSAMIWRTLKNTCARKSPACGRASIFHSIGRDQNESTVTVYTNRSKSYTH